MKIYHNKDMIFEKYIVYNEINDRLSDIALQINKDYVNKNPLIVGILNGSFMFLSDLSKKINIDCEITFMKVKSYEGTKSSDKINMKLDLDQNIEGREIIIIEDIGDTGRTIEYIRSILNNKNPRSIKVCTLFYKPDAFLYKNRPDFIGFEIKNEFIIGYGLDLDGKYRNLEDVYKLL